MKLLTRLIKYVFTGKYWARFIKLLILLNISSYLFFTLITFDPVLKMPSIFGVCSVHFMMVFPWMIYSFILASLMRVDKNGNFTNIN